jgi:GntR family transcriptional regulator
LGPLGGHMADPMYRQIADDLRQKIESGALSPGAQLPTELELREQYNNASRNTVRDAVKWLTARNLVETRPGHGTFVVEKIDPFVTPLDAVSGFGDEGGTSVYASETTAGRRPTVSVPRIEIHQAAGVVASALQLAEGSTVVSRHQQRFIDGTPWSLQTTFYPMSYVERGATDLLVAIDMKDGVVRYLEEKLGIKQAGWRDKITVRAPDTTEAAFFRLPDDGRVAVFENHRTSFDESGKPLRLTITAYPADRNQFIVTNGSVPPEVPASGGAENNRSRS